MTTPEEILGTADIAMPEAKGMELETITVVLLPDIADEGRFLAGRRSAACQPASRTHGQPDGGRPPDPCRSIGRPRRRSEVHRPRQEPPGGGEAATSPGTRSHLRSRTPWPPLRNSRVPKGSVRFARGLGTDA